MINFTNATFVKSTPDIENAPRSIYPEVLIVGKSNVGKSSLINTLTNHKRLAYTSSKPGHTRLLNYYDIDHKFYLVDAPGYGYANGGVDLDALFGEMMDDYFSNAKKLTLVLLLIDSRREMSNNDIEILDYMKLHNIPYLIVVTKSDKINQKEKSALFKYLNEVDIKKEDIYLTSSLKAKSLDSLKSRIEKSL